MKNLSIENLNQVIAQFHGNWPQIDKLYFTQDGQCFFKPEQAKTHANNIKSDVLAVSKSDLKKVKNDSSGELTEEQAKEMLCKLELNESTDWGIMKQIAKTLGVTGRSRVDLTAALTEAKEALLISEIPEENNNNQNTND